VRQGSAAVLVDCGPGVAGRVQQHLEPSSLAAVIISHLHADHYFDLVPLYYGLRYGERGVHRVPVLLPPGGRAHLQRLGRLVSGRETLFERVFSIEEYAAGSERPVGGVAVSFVPVQHFIPSHAMRFRALDGRVLAYSADSGPCQTLVSAARSADLFLCEASWLDASEDSADPRQRGHLTAGEAGAAAQEAGVRHLLLTHCRRGDSVDRHHVESAHGTYQGPVTLAEESQTYSIGR
jgi:ribonuclease BN (tRNA processing enzyme)